ncbi:MAG TPA: ABC transporter permease [Aggregatilineales bacterium]|nr:ABC transporter permease [Aggregatilineales bacterium]
MPLYLYIVRRAILTVPLLIGITLIAFIIAHIVPADPITANLGQRAMSDPTIVAAFKAQWGLDKPLPTQYLIYVGNLLQGNLGTSIRTKRPVLDDLKAYLPATLELATTSTFLGVGLGLLLGVVSAVERGKLIDFIARFVSLIGISAPVFWMATLSLAIFYVGLRIVPGLGRLDTSIVAPPAVTGLLTVDSLLSGRWDAFTNAIGHLILPSLVLGSYSMGLITRVTRSSMLETLEQDYIRTARSKGLREQMVRRRHALRNALIPVVTVIGLSYGTLLSGAVLTETIFAWPGLGRYAYQSSTTLDFPAIMGVSLVIALIFIIINLIVDVLYYLVDPRIQAH